jgi:hypothetical protein
MGFFLSSRSSTVTRGALHAAFLGSIGSPSYGAGAPPHHLSALTPRLSLLGPMKSAYWFEPAQPFAGSAYLSPSLLASTPSLVVQEY